MKYKAVLYDMDGTVLDTLSDLTDAVNFSLARFGYPARARGRCAASSATAQSGLSSLPFPPERRRRIYSACWSFISPITTRTAA